MDTDSINMEEKVDESLYSRQLYVMGHEAQRNLQASSLLVIGLGGLGVEVAKNTILAGVKKVVLFDPTPTTSWDLGGNFYLGEDDLNSSMSKAQLCQPKLAELNPYVDVTVATASTLEKDDVLNTSKGSTCVIVTIPFNTETLFALNELCREEGSKLVYALTMGLFGQVFCDFGAKFEVNDKNGEQPLAGMLEAIVVEEFEGGKLGLACKVLEDQGRHGLENGDHVRFSKVKHEMLNDETTFPVNVTGPFTFTIDVDVGMAKDDVVATQGYFTEVKQTVEFSHRSLKEVIEAPSHEELILTDFAKFDMPGKLHGVFGVVRDFFDKHGRLPTKEDIPDITPGEDVDKDILEKMCAGSRAILSPMCALIGGIAGQECLKALSKKFTPIGGFLYLDSLECLPDDVNGDDMESSSLTPRHDSQKLVFGASNVEKLMELKYFLVGAGAIGCEMLKNWAMMGVATHPEKGRVFITDMDRIEKSNLSRQFLFRNKDIGSFKSDCAANAAKAINDGMNVTSWQLKLDSSTTDTFSDEFYYALNGVCTALDNVEARLFVDSKCVFYQLPMLESGTLGTKGNTQVVVPHVTENYGAQRDPPEKSIPVCTLKNFPNQIAHTLQWARDYFEGVYFQGAEDVNNYLHGTSENKTETLSNVQSYLVTNRPRTYEDCVRHTRLAFQNLFNNQILQLLHNFPADQVTSTGQPFWSGSKRCPNAVTFDVDGTCEQGLRNAFNFLVSGSNLLASVYGITGKSWAEEDYFRSVLEEVIVPDFAPADGVKIATTTEEAEQSAAGGVDSDEAEAKAILDTLPQPSELAGFRLNPIEFDKDIDLHMQFVTACSNLRAMNYSIPTEDLHVSRGIVGRIIPAIATTTALVTGLVCLELYKITFLKEPKIDVFKSAFLNLAVPFVTLSEPTAPGSTKCIVKGKEWNWTAWDCIDVDLGRDVTLREFMDYFKTEYNLEISMLSQGVSIIYSFFANKQKIKERMDMPMSQVVQTVGKVTLPESQMFLVLEVICNDIDNEDDEVEVPYVKYRFKF